MLSRAEGLARLEELERSWEEDGAVEPSGVSAPGSPSGDPAFVAWLVAEMGDSTVTWLVRLRTIRALVRLARTRPGSLQVAQAGGLAALLAAMRAHPAAEGMQDSCLTLLNRLTLVEETRRAAAAAGAVTLVAAALRAHSGSVHVRNGAWIALSFLVDDEEASAVAEAVEAGVLVAAVATLQVAGNWCIDTVFWALSTLKALVQQAPHAARAVELGATEAALHAMRTCALQMATLSKERRVNWQLTLWMALAPLLAIHVHALTLDVKAELRAALLAVMAMPDLDPRLKQHLFARTSQMFEQLNVAVPDASPAASAASTRTLDMRAALPALIFGVAEHWPELADQLKLLANPGGLPGMQLRALQSLNELLCDSTRMGGQTLCACALSVYQAIGNHVHHAPVQREGATALTLLMQQEPAPLSAATVGMWGAADVLIAAACNHSADSTVVGAAFFGLEALLKHRSSSEDCRAGLAAIVLVALRAHLQDAQLALRCMSLLQLLTTASAKCAAEALGFGAVQLGLALMRAHAQRHDVLEPVCRLLHALATHDSAAGLTADVVRAVEAAMRTHRARKKLQEAGAAVLALVKTRDTAALAAAADAAMAALLAEEEAEAASRQPSKRKAPKKKRGGAAAAGGASAEGAESGAAAGAGAAAEDSAPAAPAASSSGALPAAMQAAAGAAPCGDAGGAAGDGDGVGAAAAATRHGAKAAGRQGGSAAPTCAAAPASRPAAAGSIGSGAGGAEQGGASGSTPVPPATQPAAQPQPQPRRAPPPYRPPMERPAAATSAAPSLLPPVSAAAASLPSQLASLSLAAPAAAAPPAPAAAAAAPPPAAPPAVSECCVCLLDVAVSQLLLLAPCGHRCVCAGCAATLMTRPPAARLCPKCREGILCATRVFDN
jgi:hypothetical protein